MITPEEITERLLKVNQEYAGTGGSLNSIIGLQSALTTEAAKMLEELTKEIDGEDDNPDAGMAFIFLLTQMDALSHEIKEAVRAVALRYVEGIEDGS